jgi:hypothetical protein
MHDIVSRAVEAAQSLCHCHDRAPLVRAQLRRSNNPVESPETFCTSTCRLKNVLTSGFEVPIENHESQVDQHKINFGPSDRNSAELLKQFRVVLGVPQIAGYHLARQRRMALATSGPALNPQAAPDIVKIDAPATPPKIPPTVPVPEPIMKPINAPPTAPAILAFIETLAGAI